jgi:NADPH2:quinone reductase
MVARSGLCVKIPEKPPFEDAATPPVTIVTCALGFYQILKLPALDCSPQSSIPILSYGGSTATGNLPIQYAKMCV